MAKTKNRIKKMTFQRQPRRPVEVSDEHKYIIEMHKRGRFPQDRRQVQKELMGQYQHEVFPRITGGGL